VVILLLGHLLLADLLVVVLLLGHLLLGNLLVVVLLANVLADVLAVVGLLALDDDLRLLHANLHIGLANLDLWLLHVNHRLSELDLNMLRRARTFR